MVRAEVRIREGFVPRAVQRTDRLVAALAVAQSHRYTPAYLAPLRVISRETRHGALLAAVRSACVDVRHRVFSGCAEAIESAHTGHHNTCCAIAQAHVTLSRMEQSKPIQMSVFLTPAERRAVELAARKSGEKSRTRGWGPITGTEWVSAVVRAALKNKSSANQI